MYDCSETMATLIIKVMTNNALTVNLGGFIGGHLSRITAAFTGPRRKSLIPKAALPAAPCASYCYTAAFALVVDCQSDSTPIALLGNDNQYRIKIIVQINIANWVRSININHALSPYLTFFNIAKIETGSPNIWVATMMSW